VDDAALAAAHRAEEEGLTDFLDTARSGLCGEAKFLNAQKAIVVRVKDDQRMVFVRQAQHFHREMFEGEQQFSLVGQQHVRFRTAEAHYDIGVLDLGVGGSAFHKFVVDVDLDGVQQDVEKVADFVFVLFDWVFASHVCRTDRVLGLFISSSLHSQPLAKAVLLELV